MTVCQIDWETKSLSNLKIKGADEYAADPSTDVSVGAYAFDDGPINLWRSSDPPPLDLIDHVANGGEVHAFNAAFELAIWNNVLVKKYGWPELKIEQCRCIMVMARILGLPGSLDNAAKAVNLPIEKDGEGQKLMLKMSNAANDNNWTDEDYERLGQYCARDVEVQRELEKRLPPLSAHEQDLWVLDQKINNRGIFLDIPTIEAALVIADSEKKNLSNKMQKLIGCSASQVEKIKEWCRSQGYNLTSLAKADMAAALEDEDCPEQVKDVVRIRQEFAKSSTAKLQTMLNGAGDDHRIRGTHQFCGAHTRRWAGRRIQPQNFPRPTMSDEEIEDAINIIALSSNG